MPIETSKNQPNEGIQKTKDALHALKEEIQSENKNTEQVKKAGDKLLEAYLSTLEDGKLSPEKAKVLKETITAEDIALLYKELTDESQLRGKLSDLAKEIGIAAPAEKPRSPAEKIYDNVEKKVTEYMGNANNQEMVKKLESWGLSAEKIISGILSVMSSFLGKSKLPGMINIAMNLRYMQIKKDVKNDKEMTEEEKKNTLAKLELKETRQRFDKAYKQWADKGENSNMTEQPGLKEALEEEKKEEKAEVKPDEKKPEEKKA